MSTSLRAAATHSPEQANGAPTATRSRFRGAHRAGFLVWIALPFVFYLVPLVFGYGWNSLSEAHNVLDPPEGYTGRSPDSRITVEAWGASVLDVPLHARLATYIHALELPLWNPYQGLGEPYAAQGDGSPYSPFEIIRALVPYSVGNYVTFAEYYVSAIFMFLLLRGFKLRESAAIVGAIAWSLCGALSLHIARIELADQIIMLPVLFWAAARAAWRQTVGGYVLLAVVAGVHAVAGFIQIVMIDGFVLVAFLIAYPYVVSAGPRARLRSSCLSIGAFILGNGLAGFYLLPLVEAMRLSFNKDPQLLAFVPTPIANVVAFFFPIVFGYPFNGNWLPGDDTQRVAWDNLHAYLGTTLLFIVAGGATMLFRKSPRRGMHVFFLAVAVGLTLRYISAPPTAALDLLPVLGRQSPKHGTELMAFCFIVAAAFGVHEWRRLDTRNMLCLCAITGLYFVSVVLTLIGKQGGFAQLDADAALRYTSVTGFLAAICLLVLWWARTARRLSPEAVPIVMGGLIVAELSLYIPLGNTTADFMYARLGVFALVLGAAALLALGYRPLGGAMFALAIGAYALVIVIPHVGLPRQFDVDTPPRFMTWLRGAVGQDYRSFGIAPDFSSIDSIQDLGAVGPLAPQDFSQFVNIVGTDFNIKRYGDSTTFTLTGLWEYPLDKYSQVKPVFDWLGTRYLVLDHNRFNSSARVDDQTLLASDAGVTVAYQDDRVTVLESNAARTKAEFFTRVDWAMGNEDVIQELKANPARIDGPPVLELSAAAMFFRMQVMAGVQTSSPVEVTDYQPNHVQLRFTAPAAGLLVLKDAYYPGWEATLNGAPTEIVRVDGLVRGVMVPGPGDYEVRFDYRPASFVQGIWLGGSIAVFLVVLLVWQFWRYRVAFSAQRTGDSVDCETFDEVTPVNADR